MSPLLLLRHEFPVIIGGYRRIGSLGTTDNNFGIFLAPELSKRVR